MDKADRSQTPVDIVWVVDSSNSMSEEMGRIQTNLNDFVTFMQGVTLDVRVTLLGGTEVCVPEPLAGPDCKDGTDYRHINEYVGSHNSLEKIVEFYPRYSSFLRSKARTVFIVTSDDNSDVSAQWFDDKVKALTSPGFADDYTFHSIVAYGTHPKRGCLTGAAPGDVYLELSEKTKGTKVPICETDWSKIFDGLAANIVDLVEIRCTYNPPTPTNGLQLNPALVQVNGQVNGNWEKLTQVQSASDCAGNKGWYLSGSQVQLCPDTCGNEAMGKVEVLYGCMGPIK